MTEPSSSSAGTRWWQGFTRHIERRHGWALATPLATLGFALLLNAIASRRLAPEGFGEFAVMIGFMTLLSAFVGLGMPVTVVRFSANAVDTRERDRYRLVAWMIVTIAGLTTIAILMGASATPSRLLDRWLSDGSALPVGAGALGIALVDLAAAESQGEMAFQSYFIRLVSGSAIRVIGVVVALLAFEPTSFAATTGYAAACLVTGSLLGLRSVFVALKRAKVTSAELQAALARMMRFGLPVFGSAIVVATTVYADTLIVASLLPGLEVGWYAAAGRLTVIQSTLIGGLTAISLPLATRAVREGEVSRFISFALRLPNAVGVGVTVVLMALSAVAVRVIFGEAFAPAALIFAILSIGVLPNFVGNPISQLLYATGTPGRMLWVHIAQLVTMLIILPLAATKLGITGVAVARSAINVIAVAGVVFLALRAVRSLRPAPGAVVPRPTPYE